MIVTEAGMHPNVSALVYVAARAPDAGEDYTRWPRPIRRRRRPPGSCSTATRDVSARQRSCAISPATCRRRRPRCSMRSRSRSTRLCSRARRPGGLAVEAEFLCRFHRRPHHQSRSRTLHGQAHGRQDHRGEGKPLSLISQPDAITDLILALLQATANSVREPDWPRRRSVHSPGMLQPAAINVRRHQRMLNMKRLLSQLSSSQPLSPQALQPPRRQLIRIRPEARTLSTIRSRFSELIEIGKPARS